MEILLLLLLFQIKHFIIDFPLQGPYQYLNKDTYGHPGGIAHSMFHLIGTYIVCICGMFFIIPAALGWLCLVLPLFDGIIHYHIDWAKMKLNKKLGWGPTTHEQFWWLLGFDQLLHQLTYLGMVAMVLL